jgi:hypothetical protein
MPDSATPEVWPRLVERSRKSRRAVLGQRQKQSEHVPEHIVAGLTPEWDRLTGALGRLEEALARSS